MIFNAPPFTFNGNTVIEYGRLFYQVTSNSRKGLKHMVDLEESPDWHSKSVCNCEAWKYGERPCRHIHACLQAIAEWMQVDEDIREEWADRLRFLLSMGHSFAEALQSPSLTELKPKPPEPEKPIPTRTVRVYVLPPRSYETARTRTQRTERRLPARLRRDPVGTAAAKGA